MVWSLGFHAAALAFILIKSVFFPGEPIRIVPTLRVDMVGLPDVVKKDLPSLSKLTAKPVEAKADPKTNDAKNEVAAKDELVFKPKEKAKERDERKKESAEKEKKLKAALNRIKALDRIREEDKSESSDEGVVIKGNKVSPGSSLSGEAREAAEASYFEKVRDKLSDSWALPPWLAKKELSAQVRLNISAIGVVTSFEFIKSSGNPQFDAAVKTAIREAQPLPKPPANIYTVIGAQGIVVGFPL
jgi:TolA protein